MKTVLILRHAKSSWGDLGLADFDRPLNKRGLADAPLVGQVLADFEIVPDTILASSARRARKTAELVAGACGFRKSIEWRDEFYNADAEMLIEALKQQPNRVERAMIVGHNPTMEETVATLLAGESLSGVLDVRMVTAALACIDLPIMSWADLEPGDATLRWFIIPRLLKAIT